ncbi:MAG: serine hydrolase domain-containing protein [Protaetiibacter sp.]
MTTTIVDPGPTLRRLVDDRQLAGGVALATTAVRTECVAAVGVEEDDLFWIASLTKPFTSCLIGVLADRSLLELDAPITDYLPWFTPEVARADGFGPPTRPITLRGLLSHTSGLTFSSPLEAASFDSLPIAVQTAGYGRMPLVAEPGQRYLYSNAAFNVAAHAAELVTGSRFESLLHDLVLGPLGMTDTTFWPSRAQQARLVRPTRRSADGIVTVPYDQVVEPLDDESSRHPFAGGGLFATAAELAVFARMLLSGGLHAGERIISPRALSAMTSPVAQLGRTPGFLADPARPGVHGYGLGWFIAAGGFGHSGAHGAQLWVHPDAGVATVWLVADAGRATGPSSAEIDAAAFDDLVAGER